MEAQAEADRKALDALMTGGSTAAEAEAPKEAGAAAAAAKEAGAAAAAKEAAGEAWSFSVFEPQVCGIVHEIDTR